jgi:hypothetical protein
MIWLSEFIEDLIYAAAYKVGSDFIIHSIHSSIPFQVWAAAERLQYQYHKRGWTK